MVTFGVTSAESTDLFVGPPDAPLQLVRVAHTGGAAQITVEGDGLSTPEPVGRSAGGVTEVPVEVRDPVAGERARHACSVKASGPNSSSSSPNRAGPCS